MNLVAVAPDKFVKGFDGVREKVAEAYEVIELHEALTKTYKTDAHLVAYVVPGAKRQPRINKTGLPAFNKPLETSVFFCDVDNPDHGFWNDDLFVETMEQLEKLDILKTTGIYLTTHGYRIVQPLSKPIPVQEVEPYLHRWLLDLERAGIQVDMACCDWTRHFRLPNIVRGNAQYLSPHISLEKMQPIELEPLPPSFLEEICRTKANSTTNTKTLSVAAVPVPRVDWSKEVPEFWRDKVKTIAEAVKEVQTEWHTLFMAIAGTLLSRKVPAEHVPVLCRAISLATCADTRTDDRETGAKTTVKRWLAGHPATGYPTLAKQWPEVAMAIDEVTATGFEARMRALAAKPEPEVVLSLEETVAAMEKLIRNAPPGVSLLSAGCGVGKTEAAIKVAIERAAKEYVSPKASGTRAPLQSKTAFSVASTKLAKQIYTRFKNQGISVKRIFGPLSVYQDYEPVCRYHDVAEPLVAGSQSIQREFCEGRGLFRCKHYDECTARFGYEGEPDARVIVGTHALVGTLDQEAGKTGLLVVDEPPALLETIRITLEDLDAAELTFSAFNDNYIRAMTPALQAVRAWIEHPDLYAVPWQVDDAARELAYAVDRCDLDVAQMVTQTDGDLVDCVEHAPMFDSRSKAPPLRDMALREAQRSVKYARQLGRASGVLRRIYDYLTTSWQTKGVVISHNGAPTLEVTAARRDYVEALKRKGAVVVMDANIKTNACIYCKALNYEVPLYEFHAKDGAPIKRTVLYTASASRTKWLRAGKLIPEASLINAIRFIFQWAKEDPKTRRMGLITFRPIQAALELILDRNSQEKHFWKASGQLDSTLEKLREEIGPLLLDWKGRILFGHYGGIRGLNSMENVDCLVTLGDSFQNIGQVAREMEYLELTDKIDERNEGLCRDELEQAHGRIRAVHRKRPGRALHVGKILPGGPGWCGGKVDIRKKKAGRPGALEPMGVDELMSILNGFKNMSQAARELGCSRSYLQKCLAGQRPVSQKMADLLRTRLDCAESIQLCCANHESNHDSEAYAHAIWEGAPKPLKRSYSFK